MLRWNKSSSILICLLMLVHAICSYADEEVEDLIDIFESSNKMVAVVAGKRAKSLDLMVREEVRSSGSKGDLGAVLTDSRFAVISTSAPVWQSLALKMNETGKGEIFLSPFIALLVTESRAVCFDASSNHFIEARFPIYDQLLTVKVEKYLAVVITSGRAFGFSAITSTFKEIDLRVRETVEEIKISASKATIRTSGRFLTFDAYGSSWVELRLN